MARLSISKAWDETRAIFARDGKLLVAVALALMVLPQIIVSLVVPPVDAMGTSARIATFAAALVGLIGQLALIRLAIGPSTTVGQAIAHGASRLPIVLGALGLLVIGMAVLLIPLIAILLATGLVGDPAELEPNHPAFGVLVMLVALVVLLCAVRLMMMVPAASAEQAGPVGLIKRSWRMTKGHFWRLLALEFLLMIVTLVLYAVAMTVGGSIAEAAGGVDPMTIGALILGAVLGLAQGASAILASVMLARVYVQLAGAGQGAVSVPSSAD